jgi:hypothetical protein
MMDTRKVSEISTHGTFEQLFPIRDELLEKIEQDMREGSYDLSQPVILATWNGQKEPVCIDGHTRLKAANNAGIEELPVFFHEYGTEQEALEKAIKLQQNRRNMTDADIIVYVAALDSRRLRGGDRRSEQAKSKPSSDGNGNSRSASAKETADKLGISPRKVEKARAVLGKGDPDTVAAVRNGEISINKANQKVQEKSGRRPDKAPKKIEQKLYEIPDDLYDDLTALGGEVEEHVDVAITAYLGLPVEQRQVWMELVYVQDDQHATE